MLKIPHLVQYQGSKRLLASKILAFMPKRINRLIEPFSGTAAISIACACDNRSRKFYINDINEPLILLLREAIDNPRRLIKNYEKLWNEQFTFTPNHLEHFYLAREKFNKGATEPAIMLYLLARCVKGSIRYARNGKFNQSPDKRRNGTNPKNMSANITAISALLQGKCHLSHHDYKEIFKIAVPGDLVYLDPPYQGVCSGRDNRYCAAIDYNEFCESLEFLNHNKIDYMASYDGSCGGKSYGADLPPELKCKKVMLKAGKSTQQTLLGKSETTFEALYLSESLFAKLNVPEKYDQSILI